jgi:MYXO-CTERM domain-containing protein
MTGMAYRLRLQFLVVTLVVLGLGMAWLEEPRPADAASLPTWTGGVNLYRNGTFTTQKSWLWCTAAGVQIVRNIVDRKTDHTAAGQRRYFDWMRARNRYDLPLSAGVDAAGWTAGLRHFADDRYRLVASPTFDAALRSAVTRLRLTNLPVALTVSHGNHGWILTGFRATADPAKTSSFTVTSVRVTGPLYGLQSRNGYDMAPNTKLTTAQLKRFFTPWKYAPRAMIWDGRYVSIQPVPVKAAAVATVAPSRAASVAPTAFASQAPVVPTSPSAVAPSNGSAAPAVALLSSERPAGTGAVSDADPVPATDASPAPPGVVVAGGLVLTAIAGLLALRMRRRPA